MIRDDTGGHNFDPRSVKLKFSLAGENGIFMPLVVDLEQPCLHWLDVHARGQLQMIAVASHEVAMGNEDKPTVALQATLSLHASTDSLKPSLFVDHITNEHLLSDQNRFMKLFCLDRTGFILDVERPCRVT